MARSTIMSQALVDALREIGLETNNVRRVVIDIKANDLPILHIEQYGDARVLDVVRALDGVEVRQVEPRRPAPADRAWMENREGATP